MQPSASTSTIVNNRPLQVAFRSHLLNNTLFLYGVLVSNNGTVLSDPAIFSSFRRKYGNAFAKCTVEISDGKLHKITPVVLDFSKNPYCIISLDLTLHPDSGTETSISAKSAKVTMKDDVYTLYFEPLNVNFQKVNIITNEYSGKVIRFEDIVNIDLKSFIASFQDLANTNFPDVTNNEGEVLIAEYNDGHKAVKQSSNVIMATGNIKLVGFTKWHAKDNQVACNKWYIYNLSKSSISVEVDPLNLSRKFTILGAQNNTVYCAKVTMVNNDVFVKMTPTIKV